MNSGRQLLPPICCVLLLASASCLPAQRSRRPQLFTDKVHGYKLMVPADWVVLPIHVDATDYVGSFRSLRRYPGDPKKGDSDKTYPAVLRVVRVAKSVPEQRTRDYAYRLARILPKDGYQVAKSNLEHDGLPVVQWDVQIGAKGVDRQRMRTWLLPREEHDLAFECVVPKDHFDDLEATLQRMLKSVRLFAEQPWPKPDPILSKPFALRQWLDLPMLERHRQRSAWGSAHEKHVLTRLPEGWTVHEGEHILLLSHSDAKTTRHVLELIDAFGAWLQEKFGRLSSDYPIRITIRLCADAREYDGYRRSGGWRTEYNFNDREVVMCNDRGNLNLDEVLWEVFRRYMIDIAPEVYFNLPTWLRQGLKGLFSRAQLRRRKLAFPSDAAELTIYDQIRRAKGAKVWQVLDLMGDPYFGYIPDKVKMDEALMLQSRVLLRFFDGPGRKCKVVSKDFLFEYCQHIRQLVREWDFADPKVTVWDSDEALRTRLEQQAANGSDGKRPRVEVPSQQARWREYLALERARRPRFLKELHARACNWSKAELTQVQRAYERFYRSKSR